MRKIFRVIFDIIIFFAVLNGYWPIALFFAIAGLFLFEHYFEIIVFGIMYDSLFGYVSIHALYGYVGSILSVLIFVFATILKRAVR